MGRLRRYWMLLRIFLYRGGYKRAEFLRKKCYFKAQGDHCYLQPWNFGTEPYLISLGNNVHVASGVTFINHDNVFIGSNSILLYDVHIGNNVIIGAGSIVTKDIPEGVVAAGVPCIPIGSFEHWKQTMKA